MTPKQLVERIIKMKNRQNLSTLILSLILAIITYQSETMIQIIAAIICIGLVCVISKLTDNRIRDITDDGIKEDNYELSVLLMSRKLILPSRIRPLLEEINKSEEQK